MEAVSNLTWRNDTRKLADLIPQEDNPRQITKAQAERLLKSWDKFAQVQTIAIGPDNKIYDGHQRFYVLLAAHDDPQMTVDVRVASRALTRREWQELTVLLHEGATGEWSFDALANWEGVDVGDLVEWGFSEEALLGAGWELGAEPAADPGAQVDKAAELQAKWQVQPGDLWEIGRHRLICGDCTDAAVVARVMGGERAGAVVTDPPYGCTDYEWDRYPTSDDVQQWLNMADGAVVAFGAALPRCLYAILSIDPQPERVYVWWNTFTLTHSEGAFWQWQPIYVWRRSAFRGLERDVIQKAANSGGDKLFHVTQKPSELIRELIEATDGDIADFYVGSGTTIVACEQLGRQCRAVEIHPPYCSVTLERLAGMGLEPRRVD